MKRNTNEDNNKDKLLQQPHLSRQSCRPGMLWRTSVLPRDANPRKRLQSRSVAAKQKPSAGGRCSGWGRFPSEGGEKGKKVGSYTIDMKLSKKTKKRDERWDTPAQAKLYPTETSLETKKKSLFTESIDGSRVHTLGVGPGGG